LNKQLNVVHSYFAHICLRRQAEICFPLTEIMSFKFEYSSIIISITFKFSFSAILTAPQGVCQRWNEASGIQIPFNGVATASTRKELDHANNQWCKFGPGVCASNERRSEYLDLLVFCFCTPSATEMTHFSFKVHLVKLAKISLRSSVV